MARGEDTSKHPNRSVGKNMFPFGGGEEHGYVVPDNFQPTPKIGTRRMPKAKSGDQYPSQQGAQRIGEELWSLVAPDMDLESALSKRKKQSKKK